MPWHPGGTGPPARAQVIPRYYGPGGMTPAPNLGKLRLMTRFPTAIDRSLQAGRRLARALAHVVVARDPPPRYRARWQQRAATFLAAVGAVLVGVALAAAILDLNTPHSVITSRPPGLPGRPGEGYQNLLDISVTLVPLALAARFPLLAWRAAYLAVVLLPLLPGHDAVYPPQATAFVVVFCLAGAGQDLLPLAWMWVLALVPVWLWVGAGWHGRALATAALAVVAAAAGTIRSRRQDRSALAAVSERAELEGARRAVLQERARIAREMHDVVAHHMSLIAVRAETAPYRFADLPEHIRNEFSSVSEAAREALSDMHVLLELLRTDQPVEHATHPRLADVPALVEEARRSGMAVELHVTVTAGLVPAGVGICAYRIIQEALSNARRHAPGAAVTITADADPRSLHLVITNGPSPIRAAHKKPGQPRAHGLNGMRERVALLSGSISAGPSPEGGFTVAATLPLTDPRSGDGR